MIEGLRMRKQTSAAMLPTDKKKGMFSDNDWLRSKKLKEKFALQFRSDKASCGLL
jgi:hypothetical protein